MGEMIIEIDDLHLYGSATFISDMKKPLIIATLLNSPPFLTIFLIGVAATTILCIVLGMLLKWFVFLLIICSTQLIVSILSYFVEQFLVIKKKKALFFVFALKTSLDHFSCAATILLSWFLLTKDMEDTNLIRFVTTTIATCVLGMGMSTLKIVVLKVLACRFHDKDFFDNVQDFIVHEHVLQILLGGAVSNNSIRPVLKYIRRALFKVLQLVRATTSFSNTYYDVSEHRVDTVVSLVFKNLTNNEPRDIQETDLLRVMKEEEIAIVLNMFEGATTTKCINQASLEDWMVKVCNNRKTLVHLLSDTTTVIKQLNVIVSATLLVLVVVLWCLFMGFGTTKFLVFVSSHILALVFIFGYYCKSVCEGIMLSIVMHPFDKGDICIIDDEQLVVEDIGLFETVFFNKNNEMISSPNSVLLSKSIINLNRSSLTRETSELIFRTTSVETVAALKLKMDALVIDKSWCDGYNLDLKGIEDMRHTYVLEVTYLTNFGNYKKKPQKSKCVSEVRKLLNELNIMNFSIQ